MCLFFLGGGNPGYQEWRSNFGGVPEMFRQIQARLMGWNILRTLSLRLGPVAEVGMTAVGGLRSALA